MSQHFTDGRNVQTVLSARVHAMALINFCENLPIQIRVSLGSAVILGLEDARLGAAPTTVYLMTYHQEKCMANCGFCPQARASSTSSDMLSRISWHAYQTQKVLEGIVVAANNGKAKRVCIQATNYPQVFNDLRVIVQSINQSTRVPISVSCQPFNQKNLYQMLDAGVERIGIPLDAATKEAFDRVKGIYVGGPYRWEKQWLLLNEAKKVFGKNRVSTHLIVGLGETEEEMVATIQKCVDMTILPGIFAFTPIRGTALENQAQPSIEKYRRIQTARHLILHRTVRCEDMAFDTKGLIRDFGISKERLASIIRTGKPFVTSGCPNCNRPFYNEKPSGPIYNFPTELTSGELSIVEKELGLECVE
jgi:biotin synthase